MGIYGKIKRCGCIYEVYTYNGWEEKCIKYCWFHSIINQLYNKIKEIINIIRGLKDKLTLSIIENKVK
jgi:hypothetical protein